MQVNCVRRLRCERGQGLAEYVIVAILVAIILIVAVRYFGDSVTGQFENATEELSGLDKKGGATVREVGGGESSSGPRSAASGDDEVDSVAETNSASGDSSAETEASIEGGIDSEVTARLGTDGVGLPSESDPIEEIQVDTSLLWTMGSIVVILGLAIAFTLGRDKDKKKKKKKEKKNKKQKGKKNVFSRTPKDSGQAMVEFLFVSITFLFTILGVIQLAMCLNTYSLVRYAAYNAARAAVVHGGDEDKMLDAARMSLLAVFPRHGRADTNLGMTQNYVASVATDQLPVFHYYFEPITEVSIVDNFGVGGGEVVTFDDPNDFDKAFITAQVVHRYELVIPLVNRILFFIYKLWREEGGRSGRDLMQAAAETDQLRRTGDFVDIEYRIPIVAHYTMRLHSDYEG